MTVRGKFRYLALALLVAALDLASKAWAFEAVEVHGVSSPLHAGDRAITVIPGFFYLSRVWNPGGIWGIAQTGHLSTLLVVFRAAAIPLIAVLAARVSKEDRALLVALAFFAGGAAGNLYDNLAYPEGVRDFLDFYLLGENGYHWPTFNVADAAICCGVALVLFDTFFRRKPPAPSA